MGYSIGQVAERCGISTYTLRYYDKEGLLPFVKKTPSGLRDFSDQDIDLLRIIECLKGTGMQIKDIRQYIVWLMQGDSTLQQRLDMFERQKECLQMQMRQLMDFMDKIDFKIDFYKDAVAHGDTNVYERNPDLVRRKKKLFGCCAAAPAKKARKNSTRQSPNSADCQ